MEGVGLYMNNAVEITKDIYWIGVNDRETDIFESLWPLPEGISYNSYLIVDDKVALIDTVKINYNNSFLEKIKNLLGDKKIDYLIINHMEPDHSGSIKVLKEVYPDIKIIGNQKTMGFLEGFYDIIDDTKVINEGDILNLGEHKLKFFITPMIHWPETMMTYDEKSKMIFSGDAFGGFSAFSGGIFDDEIDELKIEDEIRRYYSNIVGKYSPIINKTINRLVKNEIKIVGSTHGIIWRDNPEYIINKYHQWSKFEAENGVVIVYGSMYGNTKSMAQEIARSLVEQGIEKIDLFDASRTNLSFILNMIWKYKGLIIGSCTYNNEIFPPVQSLINALENRGLQKRYLGIFGSYSWNGGAVTKLKNFADKSKLKLIKPIVEAKYTPDKECLRECRKLDQNLAKEMD